jgi:DNA-binding transcriptional regulator YiaG
MEVEVEIQKENVTKMKQLQMQSGMNMADFAKSMGVPYRTMQKWCNGTQPCREYILRLVAYKLKYDELKERVHEE